MQVDPKRLHRTMPWTGGPKWTVIAHTTGAVKKLSKDEVERLGVLGFPLPTSPLSSSPVSDVGREEEANYGTPWLHTPSQPGRGRGDDESSVDSQGLG